MRVWRARCYCDLRDRVSLLSNDIAVWAGHDFDFMCVTSPFPYFVPGLPRVFVIEFIQALIVLLISYQAISCSMK